MKRAVLTGATGFIGSNLARRILQDGHEVHLLVHPAHQNWRIEEIRDEVRLHEVDISDTEALRPLLRRIRPDWIFHLAVYGAYPSQVDWQRMIATNLLGTANLLDACLACGFETFINTGTSSEYGFKDHAPSEDERLDPGSNYAVTKAAATMHCRYVARNRNANVPTLRLYSAYGPYEEPTRLMPNVVMCGLRGELPPLADPEVARDYVHVDDVCESYLLAAARNHEAGAVYNIGTGAQTDLREVVNTARRVMAITAEPEWGTMANRDWDTSIWVADNRKAVEELGWRPRYTFAEGFAALVDWFVNNTELQALYRNRQSGSVQRQ
ncbi:MAG TPA: NAD-dependent epimerase/dehydratase family protein [Gemmatimonadaceae bacterium]|nr:NAD-dependent epimerase/dehydratase family protein [Gemmatimonadaceae bacterium]